MTLEELDEAACPAAPTGAKADPRTHSVPRLEGPQSRGHRRVSVRRLRLRAAALGLARRGAPSSVNAFVQFTGFPRSGHSLIGAMLDAHPQAAIAHELDAMGLFAKGVPPRAIAALCLDAARAFRADGQWWNGLSYEMDAPPEGALRVVGDKKGDWTARWCAREPHLPERLARAAVPWRTPYVLITRHPLDNVATMSLRQGRVYDRLRIEAEPGTFGDALRAAQGSGEIAAEASDAMIDDYEALCAATEATMRRMPPADWHAARYEDVVAEPEAAMGALVGFLGLSADLDWLAACAGHVRVGGQSRDKLSWTPDQRARMDGIVRRYEILSGYRDA